MVRTGSRDCYSVRLAASDDEVRAAQALRCRAFALPANFDIDEDRFDSRCLHFLVRRNTDDLVVGTFRVLLLHSGADIQDCYSAQFYDLTALEGYAGPMAELGRFCVAPGFGDPEILRCAWGALTSFVDRERIGMLFGCSSFRGTDETAYSDAFEVLRKNHLAPRHFRPGVKAPRTIRFGDKPEKAHDRKRALKTMPSLLRSYLTMGGWVSDHAVVDSAMNTLHVFTGLEIARIPAARARVLRAAAV